MTGDSTIAISAVIAIVGCGIGIATYVGNLIRNKSGDSGKQATTNARIETKLDNISENVSSIKTDLQNLNQTTIKHGERIAVLESKTKG